MIVWSLEISVVSRIPDIISIRSRTEYFSLALLSCDWDGFWIIGIPSDSAHSLQMLTISVLKIPLKSLTSSDVCLQIAHLAMYLYSSLFFKECCGGVYIRLGGIG